MVGNSPAADILGGNRAGMHTVWLRYGKFTFYPFTEAEQPEHTIRSFFELEPWLDRLQGDGGTGGDTP